MKKFYGVGTGPGDKEYLTLKAVRIMEAGDVIFAPNNKGKNMALDTAEDFIKDKKLVFIDFPMGKVTEEIYKEAAEKIEEEIPDGGTGVFLTIGDPMVYSTFIYVMREIEKLDVQVEIVPGITSFCAGAARAKVPLTLKGDRFLLCDDDVDEKILDNVDSICMLKTMKEKEKIIELLEKKNFSYAYIKRCTLEEEKIMRDKKNILDDRDYMSFILGRRKNDD